MKKSDIRWIERKIDHCEMVDMITRSMKTDRKEISAIRKAEYLNNEAAKDMAALRRSLTRNVR